MNNKNEFAMVALDELIMEMRQTRHVKFADKLSKIRSDLTAYDMDDEIIDSLNNTRAMIYGIWEGAQRSDVNHEQFRIRVGEWVRDWLGDDLLKFEQAISRADKATPVGSDDIQNAVNCLKAAIDVVKTGNVPNIDLLYVVEEILSQPKQPAPVERIDRLKEAVEFRREIAEFGISRVENFYGMNKDKPEVSLDTILWIAANAYLALQGGD